MPTTSKKTRKNPKGRRRTAPGPKIVRKGHALVILGELDYHGDPVQDIREERIRGLLGEEKSNADR